MFDKHHVPNIEKTMVELNLADCTGNVAAWNAFTSDLLDA